MRIKKILFKTAAGFLSAGCICASFISHTGLINAAYTGCSEGRPVKTNKNNFTERIYERWPWLTFLKDDVPSAQTPVTDFTDPSYTELKKENEKWYLTDTVTEKTIQSGEHILIGSFFDNEADEKTRFFITLDGHNFVYAPEFGEVAGRYFNMIYEDGVFYGLKTMCRNPFRDLENPVSYWFDFGIRATSDFKEYIWHYPDGAYVKAVPDKNPDGSDRGSVNRNSPEWFLDNGKKYVFYSVDTDFDDKHESLKLPNNRSYSIYRSEMLDLVSDKAAAPIKMEFDILPPSDDGDEKKGFTHPCVVKDKDAYVMFVKNERMNQADESKGEAIWVYSSTDLLNWSFRYTVSKEYLPQSLTTRTDPVTGITDTDMYTGEERAFYRYYSSPFVTKIGNTWHLYAEENTLGASYRIDYEDMFTGKIVHLTTNDLLSGKWTNHGYINVGNNRVRGGSVMTITDAEAENLIQSIFNE